MTAKRSPSARDYDRDVSEPVLEAGEARQLIAECLPVLRQLVGLLPPVELALDAHDVLVRETGRLTAEREDAEAKARIIREDLAVERGRLDDDQEAWAKRAAALMAAETAKLDLYREKILTDLAAHQARADMALAEMTAAVQDLNRERAQLGPEIQGLQEQLTVLKQELARIKSGIPA